jgi:hypothetical protein
MCCDPRCNEGKWQKARPLWMGFFSSAKPPATAGNAYAKHAQHTRF